jgi:dihydroxy-acid dehydratase
MGMTLTGCANIPAVDSRRYEIVERSGARCVEMVWEDLRPSKVLTRQSLENAIRVSMAIGGSTNAIIHLVALAGRLGIDLPLSVFDDISRTTPVIANIRPSGKYLMEDMFYAGGIPVVMKQIESLLHRDVLTVTGKTVGENIASARCHNPDVLLPVDKPLQAEGGTIILYGNLAPNGAVLKTSAATKRLMKHTGRAVVFEDHSDLMARLEDPDLDIDADSVMVLKNGGPIGAPGMPEYGNLPIPAKLLRQGVEDMVRISDSRMSGTSYGTVVLHISPESAIGGPLAIVQTGDPIELDVEQRKINLLLPAEEISKRLGLWKAREPHYDRGYGRLFLDTVLQAEEGCDFRFLRRSTKAKAGDQAEESVETLPLNF